MPEQLLQILAWPVTVIVLVAMVALLLGYWIRTRAKLETERLEIEKLRSLGESVSQSHPRNSGQPPTQPLSGANQDLISPKDTYKGLIEGFFHAEGGRFQRLYQYSMANSILFIAWATLASIGPRDTDAVVMLALWSIPTVGLLLSVLFFCFLLLRDLPSFFRWGASGGSSRKISGAQTRPGFSFTRSKGGGRSLAVDSGGISPPMRW